MRLALVSDIHGNLAALEAVAADIRRHHVDAVLNLGDNLSGPLLPKETAQFLMASGWLSLAGNHERQVLDWNPDSGGSPSDGYAREQLTESELNWLRTLRPVQSFSADILLCHATPHSDCTYLLESIAHGIFRVSTTEEIQQHLGDVTSRLIACGHSHVPRVVRLPGGQTIVNPGSVGLQAFSGNWPAEHQTAMGSPDARYAIVEGQGDDWLVSHHAVPYDHRSMAKLAEQRGRPDWAVALATGYAA